MSPEEMPAGPEMDAAIAEKIFGWKKSADAPVGVSVFLNSKGIETSDLPAFSTDISLAWMALEAVKMQKSVWQHGTTWCCTLRDGLETFVGVAPWAPLAICRAILKGAAA